jgi:hypothetical protein
MSCAHMLWCRDLEFQAGWFADPVYFGDYPASMRRLVGARLPRFTPAQRARVRGSTDFYGNAVRTAINAVPLAGCFMSVWVGE